MKKLLLFIIVFIFLSVNIAYAASSSFNLANLRVGGNAMVDGDAEKLAKFNRIFYQRYQASGANGDADEFDTTALHIKSHNASAIIYNYQSAIHSKIADNCASFSNNIARYNDAAGYCGHSLGSIDTSNSNLWLLTGGVKSGCLEANTYWLDPGDTDTDDYLAEATIDDFAILGDGDGVFMDHMWYSRTGFESHLPSGYPDDYSTDAAWGAAINVLFNGYVPKLHTGGLLVSGNIAQVRQSYNKTAFQNTDDLTNPPDLVLIEDAYVTASGPSDAQFFPPNEWINEISSISTIENMEVVVHSSTNLAVGATGGTDNYGKSVDFWDVFWYSMGSYLISRTNDTYFGFRLTNYNNAANWVDEYDLIELGSPVGSYYPKGVDGTTIYMRKYDYGYVIVNPQTTDLSNVSFADDLDISETCYEITHANMATDPWTDTGVDTSFATLVSHRAKILYFVGLAITGATPVNNATDVSTTTDLNWTNPIDTVTVDVYFEKDDTTPDVLVVDDGEVETYDTGTMDEASDYYWRVDINHAGGTETGTVYKLSTTTGPPAPPAGLATCSYNSLGLTGSYDDQGSTVGE